MLHKAEAAEQRQREGALTGWYGEADASQTLYLTQGKGTVLEVKVGPYKPEPGDATAYPWRDPEGNLHTMEMPTYYISDMKGAKENLGNYLHKSHHLYIRNCLAGTNPIIRKTFDKACHYASLSNAS